MKKKYQVRQNISHRSVALAAGAIFVLLILIASGFNVIRFAFSRFADSFFYPYIKLTLPTEKLSDTSLLLQDKGVLAAEVERLTDANFELALQGQAAAELMEENRQLRNMLSLRQENRTRYTICEIILRDPLRFREGFTLDKGRRDGILPGAAVLEVTSAGALHLVGVVSDAGGSTSKVMTIANPALRISGIVSSNGEIGFINSGDSDTRDGRVFFGMLPYRSDYIHGCVVTTTGFEKGIPEGIKIGELYTVGSHFSFAREDYSCELVPAARFESLRFVAVVRMDSLPGGNF